MSAHARRFRDPRRTVYEFVDRIVVTCSRCGSEAWVRPAPCEDTSAKLPYSRPRRFTCPGCATVKDSPARYVALHRGTRHQATDPYFDLPLRLQTETRHGWLWAYNHEHLSLIEHYVRATLRERAPWYETGRKMTLVARLPRWIKAARHREEVLRAIARIRRERGAAAT